jgi:hypothetical protein
MLPVSHLSLIWMRRCGIFLDVAPRRAMVGATMADQLRVSLATMAMPCSRLPARAAGP